MNTNGITRTHCGKRVSVLLLLLVCGSGAAAGDVTPSPAERQLVLGVLPFTSPVTLFRRFAPLADYLSEELGRKVALETASDLSEFARRAGERRYDILWTAPHFVLLALESGKYRVRATYTEPLAAEIVVQTDSPMRRVRELAGKPVATPPVEAIVTAMGKEFLAAQGLRGDKVPLYQTFSSHNAAYQAMLAGEAAAAIVSVNVRLEATDAGEPLRVLARSRSFPAIGILTAADLTAELQQRIQRVLVEMSRTERGRLVLKQINFPGFRPATPREFEPLRSYLEPMRPTLGIPETPR